MKMKIKDYKKYLVPVSLYLLPRVVLAFPDNLTGVIEMFTDIGLKLIPFLAAIAFLVFVWGVGRFIRASGSGKDLGESKNILIWGVIGLFVLVTIWGIIAFLRSEFGFSGGTPLIPQVSI